jgi:hypothetical protein
MTSSAEAIEAADAITAAAVAIHIADCEQDLDECMAEHVHDRAARAAVEAVTPHIAAAERERLYAELGNDHWVIFTEDGWTTEHSVECRLSGLMSSCAWHEAVRRIADDFDPDMAGRWLITAIDGNGEPALVRADLIKPGEETQ